MEEYTVVNLLSTLMQILKQNKKQLRIKIPKKQIHGQIEHSYCTLPSSGSEQGRIRTEIMTQMEKTQIDLRKN